MRKYLVVLLAVLLLGSFTEKEGIRVAFGDLLQI